MFPNLKAEMARKNITQGMLARTLGINLSTMSAKLNSEDRIKLSECQKIKNTYFPEMELEILFASGENKAS